MYSVTVNGIQMYFGQDYNAKTLAEILEMVLELSGKIEIKSLTIVRE
jgi:pantothenate synthetase